MYEHVGFAEKGLALVGHSGKVTPAQGNAHAFWLRAPGARRDPAGHAARAGAGRRHGAHPAVGRQPRNRDVGVPRRGAGGPVRRNAGAVPGGGLPGAGQVRLPQCRSCGGGAAEAARPHGLLPVPAPDCLRGAGRRGGRRARGRSARPCCARGHRRDRRQRPLGRPTTARRPGHRRRRRDGGLLRRTRPASVPGGAGHARGRRCRPGRRRGRTRRRVRPAGRRRRRSRPGRARKRDVRRAPAVARPARARGHRHRAQLVRRQRGPAFAGWRVPLGSPQHPRESGRNPLTGPQRASHDDRPAGACTRPAARRCLRRTRHRSSPASASCPK